MFGLKHYNINKKRRPCFHKTFFLKITPGNDLPVARQVPWEYVHIFLSRTFGSAQRSEGLNCRVRDGKKSLKGKKRVKFEIKLNLLYTAN